MSRELWVRLHAHREVKELPHLLAQVDGLQFVGFLDAPTKLVPRRVAEELYRLDTEADARLVRADAVSHDRPSTWLSSCIERARLGATCYLKLADYEHAPWTEVAVEGSTWVLSLWEHLAVHDLDVVSGDRRRLLWFHEAEYEHEAFVRTIDDADQDALAF